jgi:DNA repair protein RadC
MSDIRDIPKSTLPREKLFNRGPESLKDYELLAILIRTGYKGQTVLDVARRILKSKSLFDLSTLDPKDIAKIKGVGRSRASIISASLEMAKRIFKSNSLIKIESSEDVLKVIGDIRNKKREHFVALFLDARNQLIITKTISIGTLNTSIVHPRDVYAPAIKHNAANVIIAHNHPSGNPDPSREDILITEKLVKAGRILSIELIDHLIVAKESFFSFKQQGTI